MPTVRLRTRRVGAAPKGLCVLAVVAGLTMPVNMAHATSAASASGSGIRTSADATPVGGPGLIGQGVLVSDGASAPVPKIRAKSWVLADMDTGEVLAAKAPHLARPPASTLKTLTALTLIPALDPKSTYRTQWADVAVEGSRAGLVENARYRIKDLFYAMLLPSGNDAAHALAAANGGVHPTLEQMNAVAASLQATDTVAMSPHGLDRPGQTSSAYDLALIGRAALALPQFQTYVTTMRYDLPGGKPKQGHRRATFEIGNQNPLLWSGYRGAIGVKTGYTTLAGRTFIGAATRGGRTLIVTLMGINQPTGDAAAALLTWGFKHTDAITPIGELVTPATDAGTPVADQASADPIAGTLTEDTVAVAGISAPTATTSWALARLAGILLLGAGAVLAWRSIRGRRRDARSRQRLIAAARRAR